MRKIFVFLLFLSTSIFLCNTSHALDFDFSGVFTDDDDIVLLNFAVGSDSTITIFSSSWGDDNVAAEGYVAGGGFDPILAIWDSSGSLVEEQDDGDIVGSTFSNGVSYTHGIWDSFFDVFLTSGNYTASIGQYDNFGSGTNLSDGFIHDGNPNFTFDEGFGTAALFNGVWENEDPRTIEDPRTGDWAFHILNVESASGPGAPVPEPSTMLLFGMGLIGLIGWGRKKFKTR